METFEELECYKMARVLRIEITNWTNALPATEIYRLKDQIIRSSRSVTANIAEGYGRFHHQENTQFCRQARGSISETLDHLNTALDDQLISQEKYNFLREKLITTWKILNGYIRYLAKSAQEARSLKQSK